MLIARIKFRVIDTSIQCWLCVVEQCWSNKTHNHLQTVLAFMHTMFSALFCIIGFFAIFEHRSVSLRSTNRVKCIDEVNASRKETDKTNWRTPTFSVHVIFPHSTTQRAISNMKQNIRKKIEYSRVTVRVIDYYVCDLVFIFTLAYKFCVWYEPLCGYEAKRCDAHETFCLAKHGSFDTFLCQWKWKKNHNASHCHTETMFSNISRIQNLGPKTTTCNLICMPKQKPNSMAEACAQAHHRRLHTMDKKNDKGEIQTN